MSFSANSLFAQGKIESQTLHQHPEGFYFQSCICDEDFLVALKLYINAKKLPECSEEQIRSFVAISNQYHFYFSTQQLFIIFIEFANKRESISNYKKLKELMLWYELESNVMDQDQRRLLMHTDLRSNFSNSTLIEILTHFIRNLATKVLDNGLPGFILACHGFSHLASFIYNLYKQENDKDLRREYSFKIEDFYKLSIELLIAAKLTKDYSKPEMLNAYGINSAKIRTFEDDDAFDKLIVDNYRNYYQVLGDDMLPLDVLKKNAAQHASIFLQKINTNEKLDNTTNCLKF